MDEVVAVHVLTHESMHMLGITASRCRVQAMQRDAITAGQLGATPDQALLLARRYWVNIYPNMPDDYRNGDCHAGGRSTSTCRTRPGRRYARITRAGVCSCP